MGAGEFAFALVAITGRTEASIFATMALKNLGVRTVIAKAGTTLHGKILERVGRTGVVFPEREMGQRVSHALTVPSVILTTSTWRPGSASSRRSATGIVRGGDAPGPGPADPLRADADRPAPGARRWPWTSYRDEVVRETDELILIGRDDKLDELGR